MNTIDDKPEESGCRQCNHRNQMYAERMCSFCAKKPSEVQFSVAGPMVFICNECVDLACRMISKVWADKAEALETARQKNKDLTDGN